MVLNDCTTNQFAKQNVISKHIQTLIDNVVKTENYTTCDITNRKFSTKGANLIADLLLVEITGRTESGEKTTNLFVKKNKNGENRNILTSIAFDNEIYFYKELSDKFAQMQDDANVPLDERYKVTKSYECNPEAIILENMTIKGFTMPHRMEVVSLRFAELSIQELAKFHALSFALKYQKPEYFESKIKPLKSCLNIEPFKKALTNLGKLTHDKLDGDYKRKIEKCYPNLVDKYIKLVNVDINTTDISCLIHGDYRNCNILVKEINGEIIEVLPVDYQTIHYGAPIFDFIYFLYSSTDSSLRKTHIARLKDLYHRTLAQFLGYFDLDIDQVYPRAEFERTYKEQLELGLCMGILFYTMLYVIEEEVIEVNDDGLETMSSITVDHRFQKRIENLIDEYIEFGLL